MKISKPFVMTFMIFVAFCLAQPLRSGALEVGKKAPDFELDSSKGGKFKLSTLQGKKNLLIQFYVLDFTPT